MGEYYRPKKRGIPLWRVIVAIPLAFILVGAIGFILNPEGVYRLSQISQQLQAEDNLNQYATVIAPTTRAIENDPRNNVYSQLACRRVSAKVLSVRGMVKNIGPEAVGLIELTATEKISMKTINFVGCLRLDIRGCLLPGESINYSDVRVSVPSDVSGVCGLEISRVMTTTLNDYDCLDPKRKLTRAFIK